MSSKDRIDLFERALSQEHRCCHAWRQQTMRDHCCHFVVWEILGKTESHDSLYFGLFSRRLVFIPQFSRVAGRLAHQDLASYWLSQNWTQASPLIG